MLKIFFSTHGKFASGVKNTLEILFGQVGNLTCFDAYIDESSVQEQLDIFYESVNDDDQVILLSDLYGGSVNSAMLPYTSKKKNTTLITGVNLALILELVMKKEVSDEELRSLIEESRNQLKIVVADDISVDGDDFF